MESFSRSDSAPLADLSRGRVALATAIRAGDAAAAAAIYADDATLVAPAGDVLHGRSAIEGFWRTGVEIGIDDVEIVVLDLRRRGDVAFEVGEYALHVAGPSAPQPAVNRGRYLVVHRIDADGRWRRAAEMYSPDPPLAATAPTPPRA